VWDNVLKTSDPQLRQAERFFSASIWIAVSSLIRLTLALVNRRVGTSFDRRDASQLLAGLAHYINLLEALQSILRDATVREPLGHTVCGRENGLLLTHIQMMDDPFGTQACFDRYQCTIICQIQRTDG
jgi:hypothetical protein